MIQEHIINTSNFNWMLSASVTSNGFEFPVFSRGAKNFTDELGDEVWVTSSEFILKTLYPYAKQCVDNNQGLFLLDSLNKIVIKNEDLPDVIKIIEEGIKLGFFNEK